MKALVVLFLALVLGTQALPACGLCPLSDEVVQGDEPGPSEPTSSRVPKNVCRVPKNIC